MGVMGEYWGKPPLGGVVWTVQLIKKQFIHIQCSIVFYICYMEYRNTFLTSFPVTEANLLHEACIMF